MTPEHLNRLRKVWFSGVCQRTLPERALKRFAGLSCLEPITSCAVILGVGAGHLLGVDDADLTFGEVLSEDEVTTLVSTGWRGGSVDPDFAAWLMPSILSVLWAARRYENLDDSEIGSWFENSHLQNRISEAWGLGWARERDFEASLSALCGDSPTYQSMDELYTWLCLERADTDWLMALTPLEARLLGADPERDAAREVLERARADHYIWLEVPGAWPRSPGDTSPRWLRDVVATDGARFWRESSGYVLTLTVVIETDRDERSLRRWCYEPVFAVAFPASSSVDLFIVLDADDDPGYLPFGFAYDDYRLAQQLDVLLEVQLVRVEFYRLHDNGELDHLWNFGVPLIELKEIREHRVEWKGGARDRFELLPSPIELLKMIDQRQRALFESTVPRIDSRLVEAPVAEAWKRRLQVLDDAACTHARGGLVDEWLLAESAEELRIAESTVRRTIQYPEPDSVRVGEALLHISIKEDTGWFSAAVVYRAGNGELHGRILDIGLMNLEASSSYIALAATLVELLAPLRALINEGVLDILISAGLGTYELPIHEAALRLGFRSATYSHAIRPPLLVSPDTRSDACAVLGYAGAGAEYLAAAAAELDIVRTLTAGGTLSNWRGRWPRMIHLAGHGVAGAREHETGIRLADGFLSAPGILRSVDASDTRLAFLSACDSGRGIFQPGKVGRSVPLDVALIEKGCRSVISTSAPVNDHVALIFATTFHLRFASGMTAWESYQAARAVFAGRDLAVPGEVASLLDVAIPSWRTPLPPQGLETWCLFRFSGDRDIRLE